MYIDVVMSFIRPYNVLLCLISGCHSTFLSLRMWIQTFSISLVFFFLMYVVNS